MKRYIRILLIALIAQCGLLNIVYAINIAPTTLGDDAIVNSIKQYSDLTEADVNQYKLLWLGQLGTYGSFIAGAVSTIGAGVGSYQKSGMVQNITPESVPSWVTNPVVLAGLGSLGAGYVSYKTLYPRMKAGVIDKVQRFIDVCEAIENDTPRNVNDREKYTILNYSFVNFWQLKGSYLPRSWSSVDDVVVYNALLNLEQQGVVAQRLLAQIGLNDAEIQQKYNKIGIYKNSLSHNKNLYERNSQELYIKRQELENKKRQEREDEREKQEREFKAAQLAHLQAGTAVQEQTAGLAQAKKIQTYGEMAADTFRNTKNFLYSVYKGRKDIVWKANKLLFFLSTIGIGAYTYSPSWLGFGQK